MAQVFETGTSSLKKKSVKRRPFASNHGRRGLWLGEVYMGKITYKMYYYIIST